MRRRGRKWPQSPWQPPAGGWCRAVPPRGRWASPPCLAVRTALVPHPTYPPSARRPPPARYPSARPGLFVRRAGRRGGPGPALRGWDLPGAVRLEGTGGFKINLFLQGAFLPRAIELAAMGSRKNFSHLQSPSLLTSRSRERRGGEVSWCLSQCGQVCWQAGSCVSASLKLQGVIAQKVFAKFYLR